MGAVLVGATAASLLLGPRPVNNMVPANFPLAESVAVTVDRYGVPYIRGKTEREVFFTLGYVQARDRMVQMEVLRRTAKGRLAEVTGAGSLELDKFMRNLRMEELVRANYYSLPRHLREHLEAFAEGVNWYLSHEARKRPLLMVLGEVEPWEPVDSLLVGKLMQVSLLDDWEATLKEEGLRQRLAERELGPDLISRKLTSLVFQLDADDPGYRSGLASAYREYAGAVSGEAFGLWDDFKGSNALVISGRFTESGYPILASDPHLRIRFPSLWYEVDFEVVGRYRAHGFTVPGSPYLAMGTTDHHAWGVTVLGGDQADVYVLPTRSGPGGEEYFLFGKWRKFEVSEERFRFGGVGESGEVREELYYTEIGPVIERGEDYVRVLRWIGDRPDRTLEGFYGLISARSLEEFERAVEQVAYSLNFLYADREGNIAYLASGLYPLRQFDGRRLVDGGDPSNDWQGMVDTRRLPRLVNPRRGFLVSANNALVDDGVSDAVLQGDRSEGLRALTIERAIQDLIGEKGKLSLDDVWEILLSPYGPLSRGLAEKFAAIIWDYRQGEISGRELEALEALQGWDGYADLDSVGATIYNLLVAELVKELLEPLATGYTNRLFYAILNDREPRWLWGERGREAVVSDAFSRVVERLGALLGSSPEGWRWGRVHVMDLSHPLPLLRPKSPGMVGVPGQFDSPSVGTWTDRGDVLVCFHGPNFRQAVDLSDPFGTYRSVLPGGQSDSPFSPHFGDQVELYRTGGYKTAVGRWP